MAQNLVVNPSAEDTISCNDWITQGGWPLFPCIPWHQATGGSSDYLSLSYTHWCGSSPIPVMSIGYQLPKSGDAYMGFEFYFNQTLNEREYIEGNLTDSLKAGHKYCVEFYLSAANNCKYVTDDIGIYFSDTSIANPNIGGVLPFTPQVINTQGNILTDTINWMLVSGSFIAQGGEKYITIGNFNDDANTTLDSTPGAFQPFGYYFVDDISVTDCTVGIKEIPEIKFTISPNPVKDELEIKIDNLFSKAFTLRITDELGETITEKNFAAGTKPKSIDVSMLKTGMYFLSIATPSGYAVKKFVKE